MVDPSRFLHLSNRTAFPAFPEAAHTAVHGAADDAPTASTRLFFIKFHGFYEKHVF